MESGNQLAYKEGQALVSGHQRECPLITRNLSYLHFTKAVWPLKQFWNVQKLPKWHSGKESSCQCRRCKRCSFNPWEIPWSRKWQPTPVFLPGKFHGQRSLVDYRSKDHKESDTSKHREVGHNRSPYSERWSFPYILLLQSCKNRHPIYQMSGIQPGERIRIFIWMNIHKPFELNWYTHTSHNLISRLEIGVKAEGNHLSSNKWIYKKNV